MPEDALVDTIARALVEARRAPSLMPPIPDAALPDRAAALAIQRRAAALWGEPRAGWKIGATNQAIQAWLGTDRPFAGPLFEAHCHGSGTPLRASPGLRGVEIEVAFRLDEDLPARAAPYGLEEVQAAVGTVHPAIEVVATRQDMPGLDALRAIADFGLNDAFVHGPVIGGWASLDLPSIEATCIVNGETRASGPASVVLGSPLEALRWLADEGAGLRAGEWVSTGTLTGLVAVAPGDHVIGDFGPLGRVECHFAA